VLNRSDIAGRQAEAAGDNRFPFGPTSGRHGHGVESRIRTDIRRLPEIAESRA